MSQTLIEELRKVAQKTSGKQPDMARRRELHGKTVTTLLAPSLAKIHQYLSEFKQHLATLDPDTSVNFSLREFGKLTDLQQTHYKLRSGDDPLKSMVFAAELVGQAPVKLGFQYQGEASALIGNLKQEGLIVREHAVRKEGTAEQTILMEIEAKIPVAMKFEMNSAQQVIDLTVTNFEELGERRHTFDVKDINDEMLDELGKYILRRKSALLKSDVSWGFDKRLNERLEAGPDESRGGLAETAEIVVTKLRGMLVKKENVENLQLAFRDLGVEVQEKDFPYRIGRNNILGMRISSSHASREHATLIKENKNILLCDHSNNGTFVKPEGEGMFRLKNGQYQLSGKGQISLGQPVDESSKNIITYDLAVENEK